MANCSMRFWSQTMSLAHSPPPPPTPRGLASAVLSLEDKLPLRIWSFEGFGLQGCVSGISTWLIVGWCLLWVKQNQGGQRTQL